jgi:hypothetical protein
MAEEVKAAEVSALINYHKTLNIPNISEEICALCHFTTR